MFSPAWLLLSLLCNGVHTALSAQISATALGAHVTATWLLEPGDPPEAESSFTVQAFDSTKTTVQAPDGIQTLREERDLFTVTPNQLSTGTIEWKAEATGKHQLVLNVDGAPFATSNVFHVANILGQLDSLVIAVQPTITPSGTSHIVASTSTTTAVSQSTVTATVTQNVSHTQVGPIVGGVIGGVAGFSTALILVFLVRRRLQRQSHLENIDGIVTPYPVHSTLVPRRFNWTMKHLMSKSNIQDHPQVPSGLPTRIVERFIPMGGTERVYDEEEQMEEVRLHVDSGVRLPPRENEVIDVPPVYTEA